MLERSGKLRSIVLRAALLSVAFMWSTSKADSPPDQFNEFTIAQFQDLMNRHRLTSRELTEFYLDRIAALDQPHNGENDNGENEHGTGVNSIIELNPDALSLAREADRLRDRGVVLGPLHGIPVLLKDNIATKDRMHTTAGSLALMDATVPADAFLVGRLREAGAHIKLPGQPLTRREALDARLNGIDRGLDHEGGALP